MEREREGDGERGDEERDRERGEMKRETEREGRQSRGRVRKEEGQREGK